MKKVFNYKISNYIGVSILTLLPLILVLSFEGVRPFGDTSILLSDLKTQYADFLSFMRSNSIQELIYSFSKGFGGETLSLSSYYLFSPFNLLAFLFPNNKIELAVTVIILLRFCAISMTAYHYFSSNYEKYNIAFALLYTLSPFFLAKFFNILWFDGFMIFPLVVLGCERLIKEKKMILFTFSYFYALFTNYYIAYMISLFVFIYFFYYAFAVCKKTFKEVLIDVKNIALCVLVAVSLCAFTLIPTFLQLQSAKLSGSTSFFDLIKSSLLIFKPEELSGNFLVNGYIFENVPSILPSLIVLPLLLSYIVSPKIDRFKKVFSLIILGFLILSFVFSPLYLIWHAFQMPMGFVFRFYFVYIFFVAILCKEGFENLKEMNKYTLYIMILTCVIISIVAFLTFKDVMNWSFDIIYITLIVYISIAIIFSNKNSLSMKNIFIIAFILINGVICFQSGFNYWNNHPWNIDGTKNFQQDYDKIKELLSMKNDESFHRTEDLNPKVYNQEMGLDYYGTSHYSSNFDKIQKDAYIFFGFRDTHYSTIYDISNRDTDSIFGIKYLMANNETAVNSEYEKIGEHENKSIYKNPYAFPIVYSMDKMSITAEYKDKTISDLYIALCGENSLEKASQIAQENSAEIIYQDGGILKMKVSCQENQMLSSSIMFDTAWEIKVNGEKVQPEKFMEYFLCFELENGENIIEMNYIPKGFKVGIIISSLALLSVLIFAFVKRKKIKV